MRFILLRRTEFPTFLLTVIPNLRYPNRLFRETMIKLRENVRAPSSYIDPYSALLRILSYLWKTFLPLFARAFKTACAPLEPNCDHTASLFLPLALLRFNTSLPPLVAMRTRKPCVLFLLVFEKFVRFFFMIRSDLKSKFNF